MLAGLWRLGDLALLALASVGAVGWQVSCERAERTNSHQATPLAVGIDDVTEYFLVGSLASWMLAFAGLALIAVTG